MKKTRIVKVVTNDRGDAFASELADVIALCESNNLEVEVQYSMGYDQEYGTTEHSALVIGREPEAIREPLDTRTFGDSDEPEFIG